MQGGSAGSEGRETGGRVRVGGGTRWAVADWFIALSVCSVSLVLVLQNSIEKCCC